MNPIVIEQNVPTTMRDGVTLYADVYRPAEAGRYPVLLLRTPYGKDGLPTWLLHPLQAARAGYVVILQDTRGRFTSQGENGFWRTLAQEGADGYDTVEWAATLPYSDGNVGMFGVSYLGRTQWLAAMQRPPHLRAIAPTQAAVNFIDGSGYRGGAFELGFMLNWHLGQSMNWLTRRMTAAGAAPDAIRAAMGQIAAAIDGLSAGGYAQTPLCDLPALRGVGLSDILRYMLDGGPVSIPRAWSTDLSAIEVPTLLIGGWLDCHLQGTIGAYTTLRARGVATHLLMGPWTHGGVGGRSAVIGEVDFGVAAAGGSIELAEDLTAVHLRWFDHWLKGLDNGIDRERPVRVFVPGENRWLHLPDWPPAEAQPQPFYLHPGGGLGHSLPGEDGGAGHYTYDPAHPAPTIGGNTLIGGTFTSGVKDQRPLSARTDVITFTGALLDRPLTAMGRVWARLWVSSSAPDTDFVVRLLDAHPNGYLENVADGILRARYRESLATPTWLEPGQVYPLDVDLWSVAHTFRAGHRLAVQVTSSNFPRWDRNWNTRQAPGEAVSGIAAQNTVWHDAAHPSHLLLPVAP